MTWAHGAKLIRSSRRIFATRLTALAACFAISARAQQTGKPKHIAVLQAASWPEPMSHAFRQGLIDAGYSEGRDIIIDWRQTNGRYDQFSKVAAELVKDNVDVIVVDNTPAAQAAKRTTSTIPIVMVLVADPVGSGLVPSLAHPSGNLTGVSQMTSDLSAKRLELLKEVIPHLTRVAVMWNPDTAFHAKVVESFKQAAVSLSLKLWFFPVHKHEEFRHAFAAIRRHNAQVLYLIEDAFFYAYRFELLKIGSQVRVPVIHAGKGFVEEGGLLSYSPDLEELIHRSAAYVDKILKGARPRDLPIELPTKFELVVNLKVAKTLGISIPESILSRADEVVK